MREARRSLLVLAAAFSGVVALTMLLALVMAGSPSPEPPGQPDGSAAGAVSAMPAPASPGLLGGLTITGDRTRSLALDREVTGDQLTLAGDGGRVILAGQPATISRLQIDGLEFYLDPEDCGYSPGARDPESGLAPLGVTCVGLTDVRDTATITVEGTLRLPAEQLGLRGDLPSTGGRVAVADETLTFDEATMDLRRPDVLETGSNSFVRNPPVYPVPVIGDNGSLEFEFDSRQSSLRLMEVEIDGRVGAVDPEACSLSFRPLGELSPRVTVVEVALDCADVDVDGLGTVAVEGTVIVDVTALPSSGLR